MKTTLKLILLLVITLNFTNCKKEKDVEKPEFLQAKINNVLYKVKPGAGLMPNLDGSKILDISGTEDTNLDKTIYLTIGHYTGPGTYQLGMDVTSNLTITYPGITYSTWPHKTATVSITEENGYYEGTISGSIQNSDTEDTFSISEGKFCVKINTN